MDERTMELKEQYANYYYVPKVEFKLIPINELTCDQEYQRSLSQKQVRRTSDNFDPFQVNPVKVSRRNDKNYVIDGQHTMEIVAKVSGSRNTPVWCMVYDELIYQKEANVFAEQMKYSRALSAYEIFKAKVESGDKESLMIKAIAELVGFELGKVTKPGVISNVKSLEFIYNRYGMDVLSRTLRVCAKTWDGDEKSLSQGVLKGLAKLFAAYEDKINDVVFVDKLGVVSPKELTRRAADRCKGPEGFAEAMFLIYVKKSRSSLQIQDLIDFKPKKVNQEEKDRVLEEGYKKLIKQREESVAIDEVLGDIPDRYTYYGVLNEENVTADPGVDGR